MNKKGFVLTETLAVTVFLVTIFTFIYAAIMPLIGTYHDMANRKADINIIYKLYHIRKMIKQDNNESEISQNNVKNITCSDLDKNSYCNNLMNFLELNNYELVFMKSISTNRNSDIISNEMKEYLEDYKDESFSTLILLDKENHTIVHLKYSN